MKKLSTFFIKLIKFYSDVKNKNIIIKFANPKKTNVLLINHIHERFLKDTILKEINYEIFDTRVYKSEIFPNLRKTRFFISLKIFFFMLYYYFYKKTYSLYNSYFFAYINITKPKIILDLSHYGFILEGLNLFPNIKFLFILEKLCSFQDETNKYSQELDAFHYYLLNFFKKKKLKFDNLVISVPGKRDLEILNDMHSNKFPDKINFVISGSYKADYIKKKNIKIEKPFFDITLVSQVMSDHLIKYKNEFENFVNDEATKIANLLSNFVIKKNLNCLVLLRSSGAGIEYEKNFYLKFFKNYPNVQYKIKKDYSSYYSVLDSKVILSSHSQLIEEAMILNRKSCFIPLNLQKFCKYHPNKFDKFRDMWMWNIEEYDQNKFDKKIEDLLGMDQKSYFEKNFSMMNYIISLDCNLRKIILSLLR